MDDPCKTCYHAKAKHSDLVGCIVEDGAYCECPQYTAPAIGNTIPARRTDPATSHAATRAVTIKAGTQRQRLLTAFNASDSLTDEEAATLANGVTLWSEYAKRCSELRAGGFIQVTGEKRRGESGLQRDVSAITPMGTLALHDMLDKRDALRGDAQ